MMTWQRMAFVAGLVFAWGGQQVAGGPEPSVSRGRAVVALNVPPGHLPRLGECRVWIPGRPSGRQARPRSCEGILRDAPAGAWILYRPEQTLVRVRYVHQSRPGIVIRVRVFEAGTGKFLREEQDQ